MNVEDSSLSPIACLGLPEPDGGIPFVLVGFREERSVVVLGAAGRAGADGAVEHLITDSENARQIFSTAQHQHNLLNVPFHVGLHFVERSLHAESGEGWAALLTNVDEGTLNAARLLNPLSGLPEELDAKARIESILEEDRGIAFGIEESVVETVFEDLMSVLTSPLVQSEEGRRERLSKIIDRVADQALDDECRTRWVQALEVTAWMGRDQGWDALWMACWHTALAMRQGRLGSQVPFVRIWVERQLALTVQTAMTMMGPGSLADRIASTKDKLEH